MRSQQLRLFSDLATQIVAVAKAGLTLTPADRAQLYNSKYPDYPAVWSDKGWLLGAWNLGNTYKGSGYYGSYPPAI